MNVSPDRGHNIILEIHDLQVPLRSGYFEVTFWGVPSDLSHDRLRYGHEGAAPPNSSDVPLRPFLTLPTECGQSESLSITAEAWGDPLASGPIDASFGDELGNPVVLDGCEHLDFSPSIEVRPTSTGADSSTGLEVDVRSPQKALA